MVELLQKLNNFTFTFGQKGRLRMTLMRWAFLGLGCIGAALIVYRLVNGLGASTNLNDDWAWGLWIYTDLVFSALGACGFAIAILTHIFHIKEFYPLARRALLLSLFCYLYIFLILFIEIGRWDNFYMVFASFAFSSPLYEVFACLTLYFLLQVVEVAEIWAEQHRASGKVTLLQRIMPLIVLVACVIPFGQEAALGALYLAMPQKLNVLWSSQFLPWGCLISAFFGGIGMIVLEYNLNASVYKTPTDKKMIRNLLRIAAVTMIVYFVAKLADLFLRGAAGAIFNGSLEGNMFLLEITVGLLVPLVMIYTSAAKSRSGQTIIAGLMIGGVLLNRFNFVFIGMIGSQGLSYYPSWMELATVVCMGCLMLLIYLLFAENLPIFQNRLQKTYTVASLPANDYQPVSRPKTAKRTAPQEESGRVPGPVYGPAD